jgi:hypothetical protein
MQPRTAPAIVFATCVGLSLPTPATTEPIGMRNDPAAVLAQVAPGAQVRVEDTKGRIWEGLYVGITDGSVVLDEPLARIPGASVRQVWIRGRATRSGALIGGLLLGLAAAGLSAFGAGFGCEVNCEGVVYSASALGFGVGGGLGALTGGVMAAAFPKWHRLDLRPSPAPKPVRGITPGRVGSFSFQGGPALGRDRNSGSGGLGGRLSLSAQLPGGLAPGVEFGRFGLGRGTVISSRGRALDFDESVTHVGLSLTKTRDRGRLRPYALASVGHYSWHGFDSFALNPDLDFVNSEIHRSFFGASLGAGTHWKARRNLSLEAEGRWHTSLHDVARPTFEGPAQRWNMVSLTAGVKFLW